jgi:hypothetical protein
VISTVVECPEASRPMWPATVPTGIRTHDPVADALASDDALLEIFATGLRDQLDDSLGATEEEKECVVDQVLSDWTNLRELLDRPDVMADDLIARVEAAETACFSGEPRAELGDLLDRGSVSGSSSNADEAAFLAAVGSVEGVDGDPADLIDAGRTVCSVASELGSLESLTATLTVDPVAATSLSVELAPFLKASLTAEQLTAFAIISVVSFCPEVDDL